MVVVSTCAVISCSGRAPAPTRPPAPPIETGSGSATEPPARPKANEADCLAAIDHVIDVDIKDRPADQQLSADQISELRTSLRGSYLRECLDQPREVVVCITAANNRTAIKACDP